MAIQKKNRTDLKAYFVKNAIPTESNFADLVDGMLNQADDGVFKLPDDPLSVVATGAASGQKRVLHLYDKSGADATPSWVVSLRPFGNPGDPASGRSGLSFGDKDGASRFFIDDQGRAGLGAGATVDNVGRGMGRLTIEDPDVPLVFVETGQTPETGGLWRLTLDGGDLRFDVNLSTAGEEFRSYETPLRLRKTGAVDVGGDLQVEGFLRTGGAAVNDGTNSGVGRGLWVWASTDPNHVIYSANPQGKSPANATPVAGYFDGGHRMRLRTAAGQGFLFESHTETALVDISAGTGNLWTRGALHAGNSDIYFTRTDHAHTGIGNTEGFAAIENSASHESLMILGRMINGRRVVKIWDFLGVEGDLRCSRLLLGSKFSLSGVGDGHANDDWLRLFNQANSGYFGGLAASKLFSSDGTVQGSDLRLKENVARLDDALSGVLALRGVRFDWRAPERRRGRQLGLIAQEVAEVFPEVVERGPEGDLGIKYSALIAPLIEAIKSQHEQIGELRQELARQGAALAALGSSAARAE